MNNLEKRQMKIPNRNTKKKKFFLNEDCLRGFWDNLKHTNICIIWYQKEKRVSKELKINLKK